MILWRYDITIYGKWSSNLTKRLSGTVTNTDLFSIIVIMIKRNFVLLTG